MGLKAFCLMSRGIQTAGTPAEALIPVRRFKLDAKPGSCAVRAVGS